TGLTVEEPGTLFTVTAEKRALETRGVAVYQLLAMQCRISRAQHNATRFGWVLPVEEHHQRQATLQRLMPHHGGIQVQMRLICSWAKVLETAQVLEVDLPVILPPCPTSLWVRTSIEK